MKRISQYKKIFEVEGELNLKELKSKYRTLIKEWHPDKVRDESKREEAEQFSLKIIDAYHFLVSIAPETTAAKLEEYETTIKEAKIADYDHKSMLMTITFTDSTTYEYFGVNEK
ncbi:MAG: DnaJ domain-containing protein, partial [Chitinophagales bacterium]